MIRFNDWQQKLDRFFASCSVTPFVWGKFDCCLFPADAIVEMTGVDIIPNFRGKYSTEDEALAIIDRAGFANSEDLGRSVAEKYGMQLITMDNVAKGDVILMKLEICSWFGVWNGWDISTVGTNGLVSFARKRGILAWRV